MKVRQKLNLIDDATVFSLKQRRLSFILWEEFENIVFVEIVSGVKKGEKVPPNRFYVESDINQFVWAWI